MTIAANNHVAIDEKGIAYLADTNCKVKEVVLFKLAWSMDAEQIRLQLPHLTLSQIYSALAYYYDHQAQFDAELSRELAAFDAQRKQSIDSGKQLARESLRSRIQP